MRTVYIGREEVVGYARDIAQRLVALEANFPYVWCPVGKSGDHLLREIAKHLPEQSAKQIRVVELSFDKTKHKATLENEQDKDVIKGAEHVLVLDSSVHSGGSMLECIRLVNACGANHVLSYSLVVKRSSRFVPHYFGVIVGDHDRVLFLLDVLPNNRLYTSKYKPVGMFRRIEAGDALRSSPSLDVGVASLDKISWGDLYYEHKANGYDVFLVEDKDRIAGFIKLKIKTGPTLAIDVIANDKAYRGAGIGGALMRFAETLGRANECKFVDLWAIEDQVEFYGKRDYQVCGDSIDTGDGEKYTHMRKPLLYHFKADDENPEHRVKSAAAKVQI